MSEQLLEKLLHSKKYQDICPDTVRRIFHECLGKYKKAKDAEKAAREQLHGITDAFLSREEAARCNADMLAWNSEGRTDAGLARMLERHASTRERLPLARMDDTYRRIFEITGRPGSVLDLACGLNPIYLAARGIRTVGVDISGQAVNTLNAFGEVSETPASAVCADLLCENSMPQNRFHIALMFKILPLLERQKAGSALQIMQAVNAEYLVASFPTRTLGGRNVGMAENYARWMQDHLPENREIAASFETENELFYILKEK